MCRVQDVPGEQPRLAPLPDVNNITAGQQKAEETTPPNRKPEFQKNQ